MSNTVHMDRMINFVDHEAILCEVKPILVDMGCQDWKAHDEFVKWLAPLLSEETKLTLIRKHAKNIVTGEAFQ